HPPCAAAHPGRAADRVQRLRVRPRRHEPAHRLLQDGLDRPRCEHRQKGAGAARGAVPGGRLPLRARGRALMQKGVATVLSAGGWLAVVLVATKAYYLGTRGDLSFTSLAAISYADVLFAVGLWAAARLATLALRT